MKLYYFADNDGKVVVQTLGDEFMATPVEALALEAELVFGWHKDGMQCLLGAWGRMGATVRESTVE